jgi:LmbE family N-acetylglucosaminyl deacetylase
MAGELRDWGGATTDELARLVVVSPHLDDAVLGAGHLLALCAPATVITVFGGAPTTYPDPMTWWDQLSGFAVGDDPLVVRRAEDEGALRELGARGVHLDFVEHQYFEGARDPADFDVIADALHDAIVAAAATAVCLPFGLGNPDHAFTHDIGLAVRDRLPDLAWFCYEDTGYKQIPGMLAWRVAKLFVTGLWPTPTNIPVTRDGDRKVRALAHYESQLKSLGADWDLDAKLASPEQYWRLAPPPPGWDGLISDIGRSIPA